MSKTVCYCQNVSEERIIAAIKGGANSIIAIQEGTGACTGNKCKELNPLGKSCSSQIIALIKNNDSSNEFSCIG